MRKTSALIASTLCLTLGAGSASGADDLGSFVEQMVAEHRFDAEQLRQLLREAERRQEILDLISRPAEALPWWKYRGIFVKPERAKGGVEYWNANASILERAEEAYGVPAEIIVAIIGVETFYGRHTGKHAVLDALYTLGFHYPKRGSFFRRQLAEFLLLAREQSLDPRAPLGSYAGAMGRPQFIPSSYRAYAVDFDGDGKTDIWENDADVIGSVANYLSLHGWQKDAPITAQVAGVQSAHAPFVAAGMKPSLTVGQLREAGIEMDNTVPDAAATSLIELEQANGKEYWAGLKNFYVITRYNHSNLYAMAVYQLSRAILEEKDASTKTAHVGG